MIAQPPRPWVVRTLNEVAEFFAVAASTVKGDWRGCGMPGSPGLWNLSEIYHWRESRRRQAVATTDSGELQARKRLAEVMLVEEQHRKFFLGNEQESGELLQRRAVELAAAEMVLRIQGRLESLPDEFEMTFPTETRHQNRADFAHKIALVLRELASTKLVGGRGVEAMILQAADSIRAERANQQPEVTA